MITFRLVGCLAKPTTIVLYAILTSSCCRRSSSVLPQKFTGKERDQETGLDFFGARYMSAAQGRFTSPDPSTLSAFIDNPQTWNKYSYVYNNPLVFIDRN